MNCESLPLLLNAALDGELSLAERAAMQQHLDNCPACQELWSDLQSLDRELALTLQPPSVEPVVQRVLEVINHRTSAPLQLSERTDQSIPWTEGGSSTTGRTRGNARWALFAVICTTLIAVGTIFQSSLATPAIAEISLATGSVDFKPAEARDWIAVNIAKRVPLPINSRVRTQSKSLCEIRTKSDAIVRLNHETELVMRRAGKVELVTGELWCRAPATTGLEVCSTTLKPSSSGAAAGPVFTCPSATEFQWKTLPNQELSCLDVSALPGEIQSPRETYTVQSGECLTLTSDKPPTRSNRHSDPLFATNWQLPLLILSRPDDLNVQQRLTHLLALAGQTKASFMYEDQIRQLGPPGAIPLIAYVRSVESRQQPALRYRAMSLASELAPESSLLDLEQLFRDDDATIRQLATRALRRLQPQREFPGE